MHYGATSQCTYCKIICTPILLPHRTAFHTVRHSWWLHLKLALYFVYFCICIFVQLCVWVFMYLCSFVYCIFVYCCSEPCTVGGFIQRWHCILCIFVFVNLGSCLLMYLCITLLDCAQLVASFKVGNSLLFVHHLPTPLLPEMESGDEQEY